MSESTELTIVPSAQVANAKRRCAAAGDGIWDAYHDPKDGLKLREQQVATAGARASSYIFNLAKYAVEVCPRKYRPHEVFSALCLYTEARLKEKHDVDNLADALPCWKTYKSNILGAMRDGLDPNDFPNHYELHKAGTQARLSVLTTREEASNHRLLTESLSPESPSHQAPSDPVTQDSVKLKIEPVRRFIRSTSIASSLKLVLAQLVVEADYIKKGKEDEAEAILAEAREKLAALVDRRRVKDEATKLALG